MFMAGFVLKKYICPTIEINVPIWYGVNKKIIDWSAYYEKEKYHKFSQVLCRKE